MKCQNCLDIFKILKCSAIVHNAWLHSFPATALPLVGIKPTEVTAYD